MNQNSGIKVNYNPETFSFHINDMSLICKDGKWIITGKHANNLHLYDKCKMDKLYMDPNKNKNILCTIVCNCLKLLSITKSIQLYKDYYELLQYLKHIILFVEYYMADDDIVNLFSMISIDSFFSIAKKYDKNISTMLSYIMKKIKERAMIINTPEVKDIVQRQILEINSQMELF